MLGPIFSIELMTAGRRARFPLLRTIYAGLLLSAMWVSYGSLTNFNFNFTTAAPQEANFARVFFQIFAWVQLGAVLLLGPGLTAGTIAQERERRTLDYLLASDLRSGEIILGKFVARGIVVAWLIVAGLPVMACATLMGGIDVWNLFVVFLAAMSTLMLVGSLSLAVSVKARRARDAIVAAYLIVFCWLVVVPFVWQTLRLGAWLGGLPLGGTIGYRVAVTVDLARWVLLAPNPGTALYDLFAVRPGWLSVDSFGQFYSPWRTLARLVLAQGAVSALCLGWSAWTVRRAHRRGASEAARPRRGTARWFRPPLFEPAMLWKEMFAERGSRLGLGAAIARWLIVLVVVGLSGWAIVFMVSWGRTNLGREYVSYAAPMSTFLGSLGLLLVAGRAATLISSEKERDSWTTLVSTQLTGREIVWGKVLGNLWAARGQVLLLALVWAPGIPFAPSILAPLAFFLLTYLILALFASAVGVLFSLRSASSMRAIAGVTGLLLTIGGGYWLCCFPCLAVGQSNNEGAMLFLAPTVPFLLAFPGIVYAEGASNSSAEFVIAVMAYWIGMIGYLLAACMVGGYASGEFDRFCGRTMPRKMPGRREMPGRPAGENPFLPGDAPIVASSPLLAGDEAAGDMADGA